MSDSREKQKKDSPHRKEFAEESPKSLRERVCELRESGSRTQVRRQSLKERLNKIRGLFDY